MKHIKKRISRIVDELITYCYAKGAKEINIQIIDESELVKIQIKSRTKHLNKVTVEQLNKLLNYPKHEEIEEYYWELTGESDVDNELALIGMMTDRAVINYSEDTGLEITLYRFK